MTIDSKRELLQPVFVIALALLTSVGCSSLEGPEYGTYEGAEGFNRKSYQFSDYVDRKALAPVARGYTKVTPGWWRKGVANAFGNLRTIDSSLNGFLQGKPKRGAIDLARIVVNTTLGIGGLFDPATPMGLPYQDEDLGQTLAVWGIKRSRYVYVPFLGPSTVRDVPSLIVRSAVPRLLIGPDYNVWVSSLDLLNTRAELLGLTDARDSTALDPYVFTRDAYFQRRKFLIFDGDPPLDDFDEFDDPAFEDEYDDQ